MTITELLSYYDISSYAPYDPYIYSFYPTTWTPAPWWESMITDTVTLKPRATIPEAYTTPNTELNSVDSLTDLKAQEDSFFFDTDNQILYMHFETTVNPYSLISRYGQVNGFSNFDTVVYINEVMYKPLLTSVPSISKSIDLASYDKLAFLSGTYEFDNTAGDFDSLIDDDIYANRVYTYYLPSVADKYSYSASELIPLASYYVENYDYTLDTFSIDAQDLRKAQSIALPQIPFGTILSKDAESLTDDDGAVQFSICANITDIGTVEAYDDDTDGWLTVTPYEIDLDAGTFWLLPADCRSNGDEDGSIKDVRCRNFVGVVNTSALDVIEYINSEWLGIPYTDSNYDKTAWESAKTQIHEIAGIIDADTKTFDAIQAIQQGSNIGFRYDITPEGKRTIILDDWTATPVADIKWTDIKNNLEILISTDSDLISGIIKINYAYNDSDDKYTSYEYTDNYTEVYKRYRTAPTNENDTYITNETDAIQKATQLGERYALIEKIGEPTLHGSKFYGLKLYDMVNVDFSTPNRTYWGKWLCQVIGVEPQTTELTNTVSFVLVKRIEE